MARHGQTEGGGCGPARGPGARHVHHQGQHVLPRQVSWAMSEKLLAMHSLGSVHLVYGFAADTAQQATNAARCHLFSLVGFEDHFSVSLTQQPCVLHSAAVGCIAVVWLLITAWCCALLVPITRSSKSTLQPSHKASSSRQIQTQCSALCRTWW